MKKSTLPLYKKIYNELYDQIQSGKYPVGERIPSEKEIASDSGVSRITSKKALELLAENGIIKRMPGKGSFVMETVKGRSGTENGPRQNGSPNSYVQMGLVFSDLTESYGTGLLAGIEEEASLNSGYIISRRSLGRQDKENEAIDALLDMGIDGLIVMPVQGEHYNPKLLRLILDHYPIVLLDRNLKGLSASFVGTDNIGAAKMATDYLLGLGHRHISFLSPPPTDISTIEDRIDGFVRSHAEHGVVVDDSIWLTDLISTLPGNKTPANIERDMENIRRLLFQHPEVTCLFAAEYNISLIATQAIKHSSLRIPEDISMICFDGPRNYIGQYSYTHIRQREKEMGAKAVRFLLDQIAGDFQSKQELLEADLITGDSTGPVRKQR